MVTSGHHAAPPHAGHETLGAILALAGSAAFAAYLLLVREVRADLTTRAIVTNTYSTAAIVLVGQRRQRVKRRRTYTPTRPGAALLRWR